MKMSCDNDMTSRGTLSLILFKKITEVIVDVIGKSQINQKKIWIFFLMVGKNILLIFISILMDQMRLITEKLNREEP